MVEGWKLCRDLQRNLFQNFFPKKIEKNPQAAGLHDEGFSGLKRRINGGTNLYLGKEGERVKERKKERNHEGFLAQKVFIGCSLFHFFSQFSLYSSYENLTIMQPDFPLMA